MSLIGSQKGAASGVGNVLFQKPTLPKELQSDASGEVVLRSLEAGDWDKNFLALLSQLTTAPQVQQEKFLQVFQKMQASGCYFTVVAEHLPTKKLVASATLFVEYKFIRGCGLAGHVEDVVVDKSMRGRNLGLKLIEALKHIAKEVGCYKLILDCSESNVNFYEKCGLKVKELQMGIYFPENQATRSKL